MGIDPEDLLDHDQAAARGAGGFRDPGRVAMAIAGFEFGPVAHGVTRERLRGGIIPTAPAATRRLG